MSLPMRIDQPLMRGLTSFDELINNLLSEFLRTNKMIN